MGWNAQLESKLGGECPGKLSGGIVQENVQGNCLGKIDRRMSGENCLENSQENLRGN